jgi:hypothetical protein
MLCVIVLFCDVCVSIVAMCNVFLSGVMSYGLLGSVPPLHANDVVPLLHQLQPMRVRGLLYKISIMLSIRLQSMRSVWTSVNTYTYIYIYIYICICICICICIYMYMYMNMYVYVHVYV